MTSISPPVNTNLQRFGQELQRHADAYAVSDNAVTCWTHGIITNGGTFPGQRMIFLAGVQTSAILRLAEAHRAVYHDTPCDTCSTISDALAAMMAAQRILQQDQNRERALPARPGTRWGIRRRGDCSTD